MDSATYAVVTSSRMSHTDFREKERDVVPVTATIP